MAEIFLKDVGQFSLWIILVCGFGFFSLFLPWHENMGLNNVTVVTGLLHAMLFETPNSLQLCQIPSS